MGTNSFLVYSPQNDRVAGIMLGFVGASGDHTVVTASEMMPRSIIRRLSAVFIAATVLVGRCKRPDKSAKVGFLARLRRERLFQRFAAYFKEHPGAIFLVWNGTKGVRQIAAAAAKSVGTEVVFMELAPMPRRISIDRKGVNYGSSFPRDAAFFQAWAKSAGKMQDWRDARAQITARTPRRPIGVGRDEVKLNALPKQYIFCPLQVPGDSQISVYGGWIQSIEQFINEIAEATKHVPEGWAVVVKQHPSSEVDFRAMGYFNGAGMINGDAISTIDLIKHASLVVTVNSSVGLEAALFDKPVVILGHAMYGIDGFCRIASNATALRAAFERPRSIDFDPLIRAALISYLQREYLYEETDVVSGRITMEDILARDDRAEKLVAL